jgi:hypothetical protein
MATSPKAGGASSVAFFLASDDERDIAGAPNRAGEVPGVDREELHL